MTTQAPAATAGARRLGALPVLRIAAWQVAFVLAFVATGQGLAGAIAFGALAALTLGLSAGRMRGEWLSTVAVRWLAFAARSKEWPGEHLPLPRDSTLTSAGVLVSAEGMTVVVRTSEFAFPTIEAGADLQLVGHRGPRQAGPGAWLAITVRRDAETATDEQLRVPLDNVVRRVRKEFALLTGREVEAAVRGLAHAGPSRETWRHWRSGSITQITFRLANSSLAVMERLLAEGRDAAVTVALRPDGTGVVRVAAPEPRAAERAARRMTEITSLERLDGRHGPAVLASLPIGGLL